MTENEKDQLGKVLWVTAYQLRGAMNADDFRDYMLSFLFLCFLSDSYEADGNRANPRPPRRAPPLGKGLLTLY